MSKNEPETPTHNPAPGLRSPDTVTRWFLETWRWLDDTPLRQVWPFALGILLALAAFQVTGNALLAAGIVIVVYIGIHRTAVKATHHDQAIRKTLD